MLTIQSLSYIHLNKELLFSDINFTVNKHDKVALIGNNGVGKSTLLKIIAKELVPSSGEVNLQSKPYYIPQLFGQYNHLTVSEALQVNTKLGALKDILNGSVDLENFNLLNDDWTIEDRCNEALNYWNLADLDPSLKMGALSGGQKTKVFLAGIYIHSPDFILLDEPTNHLDSFGRQLLYDFIETTKRTLIIVSHDRRLLNLLNTVCELSENGIQVYGGNYDFYTERKQIERNALSQDIHSKEKAFKKAKEKERKTVERQHKYDARAQKNIGKAGLPKIVANTWKNSAERSTAKITDVHTKKTEGIQLVIRGLRSSLSNTDQMKFGFDNAKLHKGKTLFVADEINFSYEGSKHLWVNNQTFKLFSGERVAVKGPNGSGKTTLISIIMGNIAPLIGTVFIAENKSVYIDQDYSLIDNSLKVYEQAQQFNNKALQEHEVKIRLNRFLFTKEMWDKPCHVLSGGEKMRLLLCCLSIGNQSPDIIILDEPTNNLDIQNIEILTHAINDYQGTLIVISHDDIFLEQINIERTITL